MPTDPKILIIAGLDPTGNAGLLRDAQIIHSLGIKSAGIITALTSQNRKKFFHAGVVAEADFEGQLQACLPLSQFAAIKIGMLGNEKIVKILVKQFQKEKRLPPIVVDPVIRSSTRGELLTLPGCKTLFEKLVPLCDLWTPNVDEAEFFSGIRIRNFDHLLAAGQELFRKTETPVLIKGFHHAKFITDLSILPVGANNYSPLHWKYKILNRKKSRGTGCALASLIASFRAKGFPNLKAIQQARSTLHRVIIQENSSK